MIKDVEEDSKLFVINEVDWIVLVSSGEPSLHEASPSNECGTIAECEIRSFLTPGPTTNVTSQVSVSINSNMRFFSIVA